MGSGGWNALETEGARMTSRACLRRDGRWKESQGRTWLTLKELCGVLECMNTVHIALARAYQQSFQSHPYGTLAVTNGTLNAVGDVVAQIAENMIQPPSTRDAYQSKGYDIPRTLRFFAFGFGTGPLIGRWNFFLERHFPLRLQGGTTGKVSIPALSKRVAADQLIMAPIGLAVFIGSMGLLEGRDGQHIRKKYVDMYPPALKANWEVWPVAQLINFRFMPLPYRVPFQSSCGVFWTLYLSILNSKEDQQQDRTDAIRKTLQ